MQRECGVAELIVGFLLHDLSTLRLLLDERLVLHVVHVGCELFATGCLHSIEKLLLGGICSAFLLGVEIDDYEIGVVVVETLLDSFVDSFYGNHGHHLFHQLIGDIDAGQRIVIQVVA